MGKQLRILILEDVPEDAELMEHELHRAGLEFESKIVYNREDFLKQLKAFSPDIVLSDYQMPQFNGMEALEMVKKYFQSTPLIIVTGSMNEVVAVECMKAGASDYVIKGHLGRLAPAIEGALEKKRAGEEKRKAEEALRKSEATLRSIFRAAPIGIGLVSNRILGWTNEQVSKMTGYSCEELMGKRARILYPNDQEFERVGVEKYAQIRAQGTGTVETCWQCKDGRLINVFLSSTPLEPSNSLEGVIFTAMDITERKQAERERECLIEELRAKNQELENFTYMVSHDLKSPLITIKGFVGRLEKDAAKGDIKRMKADMARISGGADKMNTLLDELLELSRIGRVANPPQPLPFGELALEAIESMSGLLEGKIEVRMAEELPVVYGDAPRILQALENLLGNAAKFMGDQTTPCIEIGARQSEQEAILFVKDNGKGIESRYQDRVFGLFDKLDRTSEGTGAGLAIVKRIIEVHGGRVWVESDGPGKGSTFFFTLPNKIGT